MWRHLKDVVKDKGTALEEAVVPGPAVAFDDVARFGFDPEVEDDEEDAADPSGVEELVGREE